LRLLYARIGKTISPISGKLVKRHEVSDVVNFIQKQKEDTKVQLFIPLQKKYKDRSLKQEFNLLIQKGYTRVQYKKELIRLEELLENGKLDVSKTIGQSKKPDVDFIKGICPAIATLNELPIPFKQHFTKVKEKSW